LLNGQELAFLTLAEAAEPAAEYDNEGLKIISGLAIYLVGESIHRCKVERKAFSEPGRWKFISTKFTKHTASCICRDHIWLNL